MKTEQKQKNVYFIDCALRIQIGGGFLRIYVVHYIQHSARTEICYFFFLFLIRGIFSRFFVSIDKQDVVDSAFCGASCLFPLLCT